MYDVQRINISDIHVPPDRRLRDRANVAALAKSIKEIGLQTPLAVVMRDNIVMEDGIEFDGVPVLVTGLTRLEALKQNGETRAPCYFIDDEDDADIWEADENLARSDLTPGERAALEHKRLVAVKRKAEKAAPEFSTKLVENPKGGRPKTGREDYVRDTAKTTGRPTTTIRRDLERGEKVAPDVLTKLRETGKDKGVVLDALKVLKPEEQRQAMARVDDLGETPKQAIAFIKGEEPKAPNPIIKAWERGTEAERAEFDAWRKMQRVAA